jgi:hypothetical protein
LAPEFGIQILAHPVCKMLIIQEPKRYHHEINGILKRKKWKVCSMFKKNSVGIVVEKIYKMVFLEGSSVPVLYIGGMVPKG